MDIKKIYDALLECGIDIKYQEGKYKGTYKLFDTIIEEISEKWYEDYAYLSDEDIERRQSSK